MAITHSESLKGPNQLTPDALARLKHGQSIYVLLASRPGAGAPLGWQVLRITPSLLRFAMRSRTDARAYDRILDAAAGVGNPSKGSAVRIVRLTTEREALDWLAQHIGNTDPSTGGSVYVRVRPKHPTHGKNAKPRLL